MGSVIGVLVFIAINIAIAVLGLHFCKKRAAESKFIVYYLNFRLKFLFVIFTFHININIQ